MDGPVAQPSRRVLYSFPHPLGDPGIGTTAWQQARQLVLAGDRVTVLATSVARPLPAAAAVRTTMVAAGRRVPHRVLGMDRTAAFHDWRTAQHLRRHRGEYDVVHVWPGAVLRTARAARDLGVPVVRESPNTHTSHAYEVVAREVARLGMELPAGHSHRPDPRRLAREEAEFAAVDAVLTPSDVVARSFRDRGLPPDRLLRHRYGYDPDDAPRQLPPRDPHAPVTLAVVGRGEPRKGLHLALQAWRRSGAAGTGARLLVAGRFVPAYRHLLQQDMAQPGVEELGFTDPSAVFRQADALLLPSLEEGSALVTYEAQAHGCALLVSDAAGAVVEPGVTGLVHPAGDVEALTAHLQAFVSEPALRARLQQNAWLAREELDWSAACRALQRCYDEVRARASSC